MGCEHHYGRISCSFARDEEAEKEMEIVMEAVMAVRSIRGELNISPSVELRYS